MEVWKKIKGFENYQVSNLGRVKSLNRKKELILKGGIDTNGYKIVCLRSNRIAKTKKIHKLVSIAFLEHIHYTHNLVVNHKNFIRTDNRLENLEIVTARENTNRKHLRSSSIYTGVCWDKNRKKWFSSIKFLGKDIFLGRFDCELEAKNAYDKKLIELSKY